MSLPLGGDVASYNKKALCSKFSTQHVDNLKTPAAIILRAHVLSACQRSWLLHLLKPGSTHVGNVHNVCTKDLATFKCTSSTWLSVLFSSVLLNTSIDWMSSEMEGNHLKSKLRPTAAHQNMAGPETRLSKFFFLVQFYWRALFMSWQVLKNKLKIATSQTILK